MERGTVLSSPPSDMGASILGPLFTPPPLPMGIALRQEQNGQGDGRLRNNLPRRRQGRERKKKRTLADTLDWQVFFSARPAAHQSSNLSYLFFSPENMRSENLVGTRARAARMQRIFRYRKDF